MAYIDPEDQKVYARKHYAQNKEEYKARNRKKRQELQKFVQSLKEVPCKRCNQEFPYYVMDFHHRNPEQKDIGVSRLISYGSKRRIIEEAEKCDILCANCHRIIHHGI